MILYIHLWNKILYITGLNCLCLISISNYYKAISNKEALLLAFFIFNNLITEWIHFQYAYFMYYESDCDCLIYNCFCANLIRIYVIQIFCNQKLKQVYAIQLLQLPFKQKLFLESEYSNLFFCLSFIKKFHAQSKQKLKTHNKFSETTKEIRDQAAENSHRITGVLVAHQRMEAKLSTEPEALLLARTYKVLVLLLFSRIPKNFIVLASQTDIWSCPTRSSSCCRKPTKYSVCSKSFGRKPATRNWCWG